MLLNSLLFIVFACALSFCTGAYSFETKAKYAVVMDYDTGTVLYEKNAQEKMMPSSMSKLMTVYMVLERLQKKVLKLDDRFTVSEAAWRKEGSKMFLPVLERVTIDELLNGIIVQSGNDACITVAEGISPDESSFAALMTKVGKEIGLENSVFTNSTGWPEEGHYMTAKDLATLARQLIKNFPEYYDYFAKAEYTYNGITQQNRNSLLHRDIGVDGLKTGHTEDAGYGLVASALQNGKRMIVVVNGLDTDLDRANEVEKLINYGFRYFESKVLFKAGQTIDAAKVWQGESGTVDLVVEEEVMLTVNKLVEEAVTVNVNYQSPVSAPVTKGTKIGTMDINIPKMGTYTYDLVAKNDVNKVSLFYRIINNLKYYLGYV